METFLSFSSLGSLLTYLNVILVGVVVFTTINKFSYIIDVIAYAISKTFIPIIVYSLLGTIIDVQITFNIGTIFILLAIYFVLGLLVIKILEKISYHFDSDTIIYFIIAFAIVDSLISWLFSLILGLFV